VKNKWSTWILGVLAIGLVAIVAVGIIAPTPAEAALKYQNWIYPQSGDAGYGYINYVKATNDGLELSLTWNGLKKGLGSGGATELAGWTAQLYQQIPQRTYSSISFLVEPMSREINYHCIAYFTWPWARERANPVNIRFSDYWSGATWWAWWID
jgi:hypothetical protein